MKGGKAGRKRKSAGGARAATDRGKPKPANVPRHAGTAPKKGSRKNPQFGWSSSSEQE